jgi:signal transduction histidine kinase
MKHSKCQHIDIELLYQGKSMQLSIKDDGIGLNLSSIQKGYGLLSIQNRVNLIDAKMEITSAPNQGFNISISRKTATLS